MRALHVKILGAVALLVAVSLYFTWPQRSIYTLDPHGLRAAYLVPTSAPDVTFSLIVQSGEMDNKGTPGIAHYAEHLAWLAAIGTQKADTPRHSNAYTSAEATEYFISAPADAPEKALAMLSGVLNPLPPDTEFMRSERDIIRREYDYRYVDVPFNAVIDSLTAASYADDPRARSVMGTPADIAAFTLEEARAWHDATHRAGNTVLVISGSLSAAKARKMVAQVFGGAQADAQGQKVPAVPVGFALGQLETILRPSTDARFAYPFLNRKTLIQMEPPLELAAQTAQLNLLYDILDSTLLGSYAKPLRFDARIAQSYQMSLHALSDRHYELGFFDMRPDQGITLQALQAQLQGTIATTEIPAATFQRVKERWLKRVMEDDAQDQTLGLVMAAIYRRLPPVDAGAYRAAARAITLDDMNRFARAFAGDARTVVDMISTATLPPILP